MMPLIEHTIQITIIDDSRQEKCNTSCGVDWMAPESLALASQRIKERFGDKIQLAYLNLSKVTASHEASKWSQTIKDKNLSLPLLLISGQSRISGQFDLRQLLDAIEVELEMGA